MASADDQPFCAQAESINPGRLGAGPGLLFGTIFSGPAKLLSVLFGEAPSAQTAKSAEN